MLPRERLLELTETNDHLTDDKVSVSIFELTALYRGPLQALR